MGKKIKNTISPSKKVNNIIDLEKLDSHLYNNCNMVIDFSFEGAFVSVNKVNLAIICKMRKNLYKNFEI